MGGRNNIGVEVVRMRMVTGGHVEEALGREGQLEVV